MPFSSICQNAGNHNKASRGLEKIVNNCLKQKKFKQYLLIGVESFDYNASFMGEASMISFSFEFPTDHRIVHEEILIFDQIGLLAQQIWEGLWDFSLASLYMATSLHSLMSC